MAYNFNTQIRCQMNILKWIFISKMLIKLNGIFAWRIKLGEIDPCLLFSCCTSQSLFRCALNFWSVIYENHTHSHTHSLTHTHTYKQTHTHLHALPYTLTRAYTISHTHTRAFSSDMNNSCHSQAINTSPPHHPGVKFTNILWAAFSYKRLKSSFSVLTL